METNAYPLLGVIGPAVNTVLRALTIVCVLLTVWFNIQTAAILKGMRR